MINFPSVSPNPLCRWCDTGQTGSEEGRGRKEGGRKGDGGGGGLEGKSEGGREGKLKGYRETEEWGEQISLANEWKSYREKNILPF